MGWATRSGEIAPVDVLLRHGAAINLIEYDKTPLMVAASEEKLDMIAFLIDQGADIDARDSEGCTAFMSSAKHVRPEVLALLAQRGADLYVRDNNGMTALQLARGEDFATKQEHQQMGSVVDDSAESWYSRLRRSIAILEQVCRY
jgi:ankyrin repeat protein